MQINYIIFYPLNPLCFSSSLDYYNELRFFPHKAGFVLQCADQAQTVPDLQTWASVPEGSRAEVFTGQIPETLVRRLKLPQTSRESAESPPEERVRDLSCVDDVIRRIWWVLSSDLTETRSSCRMNLGSAEAHSSLPESNKTLLDSSTEDFKTYWSQFLL